MPRSRGGACRKGAGARRVRASGASAIVAFARFFSIRVHFFDFAFHQQTLPESHAVSLSLHFLSSRCRCVCGVEDFFTGFSPRYATPYCFRLRFRRQFHQFSSDRQAGFFRLFMPVTSIVFFAVLFSPLSSDAHIYAFFFLLSPLRPFTLRCHFFHTIAAF